MIHIVPTITIAGLREILSSSVIWHLNTWIFYVYEGIDVDVDREGPEFYPYGPRIAQVSLGINKGEKIIDLVYGVDYSDKDTGFEDIMKVVKKYDLPDTTKIFLRKYNTFDFQPIKSMRFYSSIVFFELY